MNKTSQNQKEWMTSSDTKRNMPINILISLKTKQEEASCSLLYNIILLGRLLSLTHLVFSLFPSLQTSFASSSPSSISGGRPPTNTFREKRSIRSPFW